MQPFEQTKISLGKDAQIVHTTFDLIIYTFNLQNQWPVITRSRKSFEVYIKSILFKARGCTKLLTWPLLENPLIVL